MNIVLNWNRKKTVSTFSILFRLNFDFRASFLFKARHANKKNVEHLIMHSV